MGSAFYPDFEHPQTDLDSSTAVSGKALADWVEALEDLCKRLQVAGFWSFYSESKVEAFDKIGEPPPPDLIKDTGIQWSEPAHGLATVAALIGYLRSHPNELPETPEILTDLDDLQRVLLKAQQHGTKFRLKIDI